MVVDDASSSIGLVGSAASKDHENRRFEQVQALQLEWKEAGRVMNARKDIDKVERYAGYILWSSPPTTGTAGSRV